MIRNKIILLLGLCFTLSCNLNRSADNEVVIDVDDDFQLTFRENLATPEDDLIFLLTSIENRECETDTLLMQVDNFATAVRIDIDVVNGTQGCLPGTLPAKTQAQSAEIRNERMALSIQLEDLVDNQGDIFKTDQDFLIKMETTHGFYLPYETLRRVPRSSIWGYIGFTPNLREEAQSCMEQLLALTQNIEVDPGEYGYFRVNKDQEVRVLGQEDIIMYTQPFLRAFNLSEKRNIRALFEAYQERYPAMKFAFYDSFGDQF